MDCAGLASAFERWSVDAAEHGSPLYAELSASCARDPELLELAAQVRRPPATNVLFAAIHFLLLADPRAADATELSSFYASCVAAPAPVARVFAAFKAFALARRAELEPLLRTRITQTNEVRRAGFLLAAFETLHAESDGRPLALIDVGCSAGLHLCFDQFRYEFRHHGGVIAVGDANARVVVATELRGPLRPRFGARPPPVAWRVGLDLSPVDLADPVERRWLEALVWPEHADRRALLRAAIDCRRATPLQLIAGDALATLPTALDHAPPPREADLVAWHAHALCQARPEEVAAFEALLAARSRERTIHLLQCEEADVHHVRYAEGRSTRRHLARKDGHGRWIEWRAE